MTTARNGVKGRSGKRPRKPRPRYPGVRVRWSERSAAWTFRAVATIAGHRQYGPARASAELASDDYRALREGGRALPEHVATLQEAVDAVLADARARGVPDYTISHYYRSHCRYLLRLFDPAARVAELAASDVLWFVRTARERGRHPNTLLGKDLPLLGKLLEAAGCPNIVPDVRQQLRATLRRVPPRMAYYTPEELRDLLARMRGAVLRRQAVHCRSCRREVVLELEDKPPADTSEVPAGPLITRGTGADDSAAAADCTSQAPRSRTLEPEVETGHPGTDGAAKDSADDSTAAVTAAVTARQARRCPRCRVRLEVAASRRGRVLELPGRERDADLVELLALTGIRAGELGRVRLGDFDDQRRQVLLVSKDRGHPRALEVVGRLRPILDRLRADAIARDGAGDAVLIFPNSMARLSDLFARWKRRLGDDRLCGRTLRHSFVTGLHYSGAQPVEVRGLAGHRHLSTTDRYTHEISPRRVQVLEAWQDRLVNPGS